MEAFERKAYENWLPGRILPKEAQPCSSRAHDVSGKAPSRRNSDDGTMRRICSSTSRKPPDDVLGYFVDLHNDRDDPSNRIEIDFLIVELCENAAMKCRVSHIEVKSSKHYRTVSLDKFKAKFDKKVSTRYVLHPKPLVMENDVVKLPIYMAGLL